MLLLCEWDEAGGCDENVPADWWTGDGAKFPVEGCLDNSKGMLPVPETDGIPTRSENGWPKASQSFSTSACIRKKNVKQN